MRLIRVTRVKMQVEPQVVPGRFEPGMNSRKRKQLKIAAKLNELVAEYFPNGGYSVMDAHYVDADLCRDRQRATRCAEYLLTKLSKPSQALCPPAATDFEKSMWADL